MVESATDSRYISVQNHPEMDSKQNQSVLSSPSNNEIQDLQKELKDVDSELQSVVKETEQVNEEIRNCRLELDRRMLLVTHVDERVLDALVQLDAARQKKVTLLHQIRELSDVTRMTEPSAMCLSAMQRQEAMLLEEERDLKLQWEHQQQKKKKKKKGRDEQK